MAMDDEGLSQGFAFHLADILQQPGWQDVSQAEPFSTPFALDLVELDFAAIDKNFHDDLHLPALEGIGALGQDGLDKPESDEESSSPSLDPGEAPVDETLDIWTLDPTIDTDDGSPCFRTWEGFGKPYDHSADSHVCLSEAGPLAFDAAISRFTSAREGAGVLPQDVMLRALCNLAVGRSSVFFQWDSGKGTFEPTLRDVPISGFSLICCDSFVATMIDCGSKFRKLADFGSTMSTRQHCASLLAFKGCVVKILDVVENGIASEGSRMSSVLQLQRLVDRPRKLLILLTKLYRSLNGLTTDEAVISKLSDEISTILSVDHVFAAMLQEVLARVSGPWLRDLCADLGMDPYHASQDHSNGEGAVPGENFESSLPIGEEVVEEDSFPGFVQEIDRSLIGHTKASLRALRRSETSRSPFDPTRSTKPSLDATRGSYRDVRPVYGEGLEIIPDIGSTLDLSAATSPFQDTNEQLAWATDDIQQGYLADLGDRMSQSPKSSHGERLESAVLSALDVTRIPSRTDMASFWRSSACDPLEKIRPLLCSHAQHVNKVLLRHLFTHCRLLDHLTLLREHFLFGNGVFVDRLTTALFNTDIQSAERRRGVRPTGTIMGLRLGTGNEQQWPPASSAVQLALMGILAETYPTGYTTTQAARPSQHGLSFLIRELSDSEIEKVINPHSIHALDFLKLQYTPPAPLDSIVTPSALKTYDDVFRFLLKLLRMVHVTTKLRERYCMRNATAGSHTSLRSSGVIHFAIRAHHFVSTLMTYCLEVGIGSPWTRLFAQLKTVERDIDQETKMEPDGAASLIGLEHLHRLHQSSLDSIKSRLFLRRRYGKISEAIENVLTTILDGAIAMETDDSRDMSISGIERSLGGHIKDVIALLQGAVDRSARSEVLDGNAEEDVDAIRLLLLSLDWNGFYAQTDREAP